MSEYSKKGSGSRRRGKYPDEIRIQAVEMYNSCRAEFTSNDKAAQHVADLLGIGSMKTVQKWVHQARIDEGTKDGITTDEREEIRKLRRENAELRRANGILKAASAFFAAELDRPQNK